MNEGVLLRRHLTELTGIELSRGGLSDALEAFVLRRLRELGLRGEGEYITQLEAAPSVEFSQLIDVVSVPHTWFFRDPVQLEAVEQTLLSLARGSRPLRVWVPGCATGEDVYSVALLAQRTGLPVHVTGSDISQASLERADQAVYGPFSLRELPAPYLQDFEIKRGGRKLKDSVRAGVRFVQHNLMAEPLSCPGGWDLILCRNVFIYFSAETAAACADRLASVLHPAGYAFFGAGELISRPPTALVPVLRNKRVAYRRPPVTVPSPSPDVDTTETPLARSVATRSPAAGQVGSAGQGLERAVPKSPPASLSVPLRGLGPAPSKPQTPTPTSPELSGPSRTAAPDWGHLLAAEDIATATAEALGLAAERPLYPGLRLVSGMLLFAAGDYRRAFEQLGSALLLDQSCWPAALYQGLCLDGLGRPSEARERFRLAERLLDNPGATPTVLPPSLQGLSAELHQLARIKARRTS